MKQRFGKKPVLFGAIFLLLIGAAAASATNRTPRHPADESSIPFVADEEPVSVLVLKLHEGTRARLKAQRFVVKDRSSEDLDYLAAEGLTPSLVEADLQVLQGLFAGHRAVIQVRPLFEQSEAQLEQLKADGELQSGKQLADLNLYFSVDLADGVIAANLRQLVDDLNALPSVEIAYLSPPPMLPSVPTPSLEVEQSYLNPAPSGIDARYAWTVAGGRGEGIRIVDVEYAWTEGHEDLPPFFYRGGTVVPADRPCAQSHGTAVLGEIVGRDNSFGVTGIASSAEIGVQSVVGNTLCNTFLAFGPPILSAALQGDIVVVELQANLVPAEYLQDAFDAIQTATSHGVVVVEAAGNGHHNLDDEAAYGRLFDRTFRDSGAIIVGSSQADGVTPFSTSTYGSRVDLHGWGERIVTTGWDGNRFHEDGIVTRSYTNQFGGTSGATPMIAGAVAVLKGVARAAGFDVGPAQAVQLLRDTGTPQAPHDRLIGPLPNLRAALISLGVSPTAPTAAFTFECTGRNCSFNGQGSTGANSWSWSFGDSTSGSGSTVSHNYAASGTFIVRLTVQGGGGQTGSVEHSVHIGSPPVASFTITCSARVCEADGSASTSDFGTLLYQFNFGGAGNTIHLAPGVRRYTYNAPGAYSVSLRVTDEVGQIGTTSKSVVVRSDGVRVQAVGVEADIDVFRLGTSNSPSTYIETKLPPTTVIESPWPVAGDWNGDGIDSVGKFDPGTDTFYLRNSHTQGGAPDFTFAFGNVGADNLPIAGDWNGDGRDTIGVFDATAGMFRLKNSNAAGAPDLEFAFTGSQTSWLPIAGDWDGDGVDTVGLYDPATSTFFLRNANSNGAVELSFVFGTPGSGLLPIAGDWNGDGWDSIGLYDPLNRRSLLRNLNSPGPADLDFKSLWARGGKPIAGDWDGL